jgi:hypothetical protein
MGKSKRRAKMKSFWFDKNNEKGTQIETEAVIQIHFSYYYSAISAFMINVSIFPVSLASYRVTVRRNRWG